MTPTVRLRAGELEAEVAADRLLEVRSLTHRGRELLVAAAELPAASTVHGAHAGITFLHPWANRLGAESYTLEGRHASLAAADGALARDGAGLALHGLAAPPGAWSLTGGEDRAVARLVHDGTQAAFPFPHEVRIVLRLQPAGLEVVTTLRATSPVPVPVALGWHPYLRLPDAPRATWTLSLPPRRHLDADERGLPTGGEREEPAEDEPLADRALDDGYRLDGGPACLAVAAAGRRLAVRLRDGYPAAQVYAPRGIDVVSLEPMTAVTNALVTGEGLRTARPGAPYRAAFAVEVG